MLTLVLYGLIAVGLMVALFLLVVRFLPAGEQIAPVLRDEPLWLLPPEGHLNASDVAEVRLPVALRGYRFAETDLLLDRLVEEIRTRDEQIDRLSTDLTRVAHRPSPGNADPEQTLVADDAGPSAPAPESVAGDHPGAHGPERGDDG